MEIAMIETILEEKLIEKVLFSLIILAAAAMLGRITKSSVKKIDNSIKSFDLSQHATGVISQTIKYAIYATAIAIVLSIFGLTEALYTLLTGGAILGFAVGYASKDIISNMLAGVILALDKPFRIGDDVEVNGIRGKVKLITLRTTRLITEGSVFAEVPNATITAKPIKNYSRKDF